MLPGILVPQAAGWMSGVEAQTIEITSGSGNWTVLPYNQIIIEIWGGGGRGGGLTTVTAATATTVTLPSGTMTANPGNNGKGYANEGSVAAATGGTASGGDVNTTGGNFERFTGWELGRGGNAPDGQTISGGAGGFNAAGAAPGGGGSSGQSFNASVWQTASGGGAGGYSRKTIAFGALEVGASIPYSVGLGAVASSSIGNGGAGRILIRIS